MWRRKSLCLFAVWVLIEAYEGSTGYNSNCLVQVDSSPSPLGCDDGDDELSDSSLHIVCTATEVTASFVYTASSHDSFVVQVNLHDVAWICESASGRDVYVCERPPGLLTERKVDFALNITERGRRGSNCTLQICVSYESVAHRIPSNVCEIEWPTTTSSVINPTTTAPKSNAVTHTQTEIPGYAMDQHTAVFGTADQTTPHVTEGEIETQDSSADALIINILAPLMGVLIFLILLVIAVIIPLISIIYLRMRKFSHNWQAYGNPDLPFDPHYTPVDIEKPSFSPTPRLSLLSVDMFQTLYKARTNHLANRNGNLYIDQPSIHPNSHYDQSGLSDSHGAGENGSELSEVSILHTVTSLDDDTLSKICTVSESSYQPLNDSEQYIQHVPLPRKSNSLKDDYQDNLLGSSDLDYTDSALVGTREGDASHNRLHFWEQNSLPLPSLSDPFPSLCADLAEANPIQLDKPYISSESGYIQSHDANCSAAQSLYIEEDTNLDLDTTNQRPTITQLAQTSLIERLESPTLLDNESMKSMDSGLNCYDFGEHTQMNNSEDEVDMYESDPTNDEEHHGYIEHEQHDNILSKTGLMPYPLDIDLDFIPVPSGPVRPTTIDIRHTSDDTTTSDLSSGYITSCMSHDDNAIMELLFQQKLKDVKET